MQKARFVDTRQELAIDPKLEAIRREEGRDFI